LTGTVPASKRLFDDFSEEGSGSGHVGPVHGKNLGVGMVVRHGGDRVSEIALAIEMGADALDIGKTISVSSRLARAHNRSGLRWRAAWHLQPDGAPCSTLQIGPTP
jgi:hypothetical protein